MADVGFVVNEGLTQMISALSTSATVPKWIGWGIGGSAVATSINTALTSEQVTIRCTGTVTIQTWNTTSDTLQVTGTMTATAAYTITEVGLFNASTAGSMFLRVTCDAINLGIGDSIAWTIKAIADQA
jgi:hypothetical protein